MKYYVIKNDEDLILTSTSSNNTFNLLSSFTKKKSILELLEAHSSAALRILLINS